jgi:anti-sigma-K factor RskA
MANTLDTLQPYVEQLFDDSDVRRQLARATANLRGAQARAGRKRSKKKALQDDLVRRRVADAARAAFAAGLAIKEGPERKRRRGRRTAVLTLALLGAAAFVAFNEDARAQALSLIGQGQPQPQPQEG